MDSLKEAQTSINNTILSNKPDLSSLTTEIRSLLQVQTTKIDEQEAKLATLTTLVNSQRTQIHQLKNLVKLALKLKLKSKQPLILPPLPRPKGFSFSSLAWMLYLQRLMLLLKPL